jgi:hypothetical protein
LFDLIDDPDEMNNLAWDKNHRAKLESLRALLIKERQRLNDGNSPFAFSANQGKEFWKNFGSP